MFARVITLCLKQNQKYFPEAKSEVVDLTVAVFVAGDWLAPLVNILLESLLIE